MGRGAQIVDDYKDQVIGSAFNWILTAESGQKTLMAAEHFLLFGLQYVPDDFWTDPTFLTLASRVFNNLSVENIKHLTSYIIFGSSVVTEPGYLDTKDLSLYPESLRDDLAELYTKTNPDYQTGVELLSSAIRLYEQKHDQGKEITSVYWQPHPDAK